MSWWRRLAARTGAMEATGFPSAGDGSASAASGDDAIARRDTVAPGCGLAASGADGTTDASPDAVEGHGESLSAEALLARLRLHALEDATPGVVPDDPAHREVQQRAAAMLARIETQPERMPRRPQLLPALMRETGSGDASAKAIARLVQQDPTLTGNVLRVANSAAYRGAGRPIDSVERAVARLGTEGLRRIVAATLLQPVMDARRGAFAGFAPVAWAHSLAAASVAAEHAARHDPDLASSAHMAALLHGLGSIVVVQVVREAYAKRPLLMPAATVPAALLDQAGATAARIAGAWELSAPVLAALAPAPTVGEGAATDVVRRAVRLGRLVAAAVVLVRAGRLELADAQATVAALDAGGAPAVAMLQRLLAQESDALA